MSFTGESESWIAGTAARMFHTTDGATWGGAWPTGPPGGLNRARVYVNHDKVDS